MRERILKIVTMEGWKGRLLLFGAGILAALALAPFYAWPLLIPAYGVLFLQWLNAPTARAAFWRGWWWGMGFFIAGLYWIAIALTVDMARFGWMIPFALIGLNGYFALFPAVAGLVFKLALGNKKGGVALALFTLCLFASELLRATLFTGFPWNLIGYAWGAGDSSIQAASLIGVWGLTLITPFLAASPVGLLVAGRGKLLSGLSLASVIGLLAFGHARLSQAETEPSGLTVRLVQGNIPQTLKWEPEHLREALAVHMALSQNPAVTMPDLIIWPETAFPFTFRDAARAITLSPGQTLLTGAVRAEGGQQDLRLWNSLVALDDAGNRIGLYDKRHLVPFGEFMPLRDLLPVDKITAGSVDFSSGEKNPELTLSGVTLRAMICYEVIFPSYAQRHSDTDWLLTITNDAWYGHSSGPYQHRDMARFRAVEQGLPLLRAANTGISVAYDPYGRTLAQIPWDQRGFVDVKMPKALPQNTLYSSISLLGINY